MIPRKRLDKLVPLAIQAINDAEMVEVKANKRGEQVPSVPDTFTGYISSFGADMIQTSPLAAAIFFDDRSANTKQQRWKITNAILLTMRSELGKGAVSENYKTLSEFLRRNNGMIPKQEVENVFAAAVAVKIGLRTFNKIKDSKDAESD